MCRNPFYAAGQRANLALGLVLVDSAASLLGGSTAQSAATAAAAAAADANTLNLTPTTDNVGQLRTDFVKIANAAAQGLSALSPFSALGVQSPPALVTPASGVAAGSGTTTAPAANYAGLALLVVLALAVFD